MLRFIFVFLFFFFFFTLYFILFFFSRFVCLYPRATRNSLQLNLNLRFALDDNSALLTLSIINYDFTLLLSYFILFYFIYFFLLCFVYSRSTLLQVFFLILTKHLLRLRLEITFVFFSSLSLHFPRILVVLSSSSSNSFSLSFLSFDLFLCYCVVTSRLLCTCYACNNSKLSSVSLSRLPAIGVLERSIRSADEFPRSRVSRRC